MPGVEVGVAESDMSELVLTSDTGLKGKLELGLRIFLDLVLRGEKWNGFEDRDFF